MLIESCARTSFYARALWVYEGFSEVSKLPSKRRPSVFLMLVPDRLLTERTDRPTRKTRISISAKSTALWFWSVLSFFIEFYLINLSIPTKVHCPDVETSPPQAAGLELVVRAWWRGARSGCGPKEAGCGDHTFGVEMIPWKESFVDLSESLHFCTAFRSVPVSPVSCCQTAWLRKTASGGVMGGAHDRLLRCGPGPEAARITLPLAVPF